MTAQRALYILIALLLASAAFAGFRGADSASLSGSMDLMLNALVLAFTYIWYYQDATERKFKRSTAARSGYRLVLRRISALLPVQKSTGRRTSKVAPQVRCSLHCVSSCPHRLGINSSRAALEPQDHVFHAKARLPPA